MVSAAPGVRREPGVLARGNDSGPRSLPPAQSFPGVRNLVLRSWQSIILEVLLREKTWKRCSIGLGGQRFHWWLFNRGRRVDLVKGGYRPRDVDQGVVQTYPIEREREFCMPAPPRYHLAYLPYS